MLRFLLKRYSVVLSILFSLLFFSPADAEQGRYIEINRGHSIPDSATVVPEELGEVVYQYNRQSPRQLYIVGMGHRDSLTGSNGADTVQSQIEVYRIGEWLIHNEGLELLLPEGFLMGKSGSKRLPSGTGNRSAKPVDTSVLEEQLGDDRAHVNSEMLLIRNFNLHAEQVEDPELFDAVHKKLRLLQDYRNDPFTYLFERSQLDYLQEMRTASMLQKIPDIIENRFGQGGIRKKQALFTIGLAHLDEIIRYMTEQQIIIHSPLFAPFEDYLAGVNLLQADFGITVIVPPSLKDRTSSLLASCKSNISSRCKAFAAASTALVIQH